MQSIIWIVFVGSVALALQAVLFVRFALRNIRYEHSIDRTRLFAGEAIEMVEVLENHKLLPIPWLRVERRMPSSFLFGKQQNLAPEGGRYHRSVFFLGPYRKVIRRHTLRCTARGVFDLSSSTMTTGDLFGIRRVFRQYQTELTLTVYPRLLPPDASLLPSSRWQGELIVRRWIVPDPFLYSGIRDYRAGDAIRDVHWRASAKTGRMQVMQRDFTASPRLVVLLNIQLEERQWNMPDKRGLGVIEQAISLAATAAIHAIENGVEAGVASNARVYSADRISLTDVAASYHRPNGAQGGVSSSSRTLPDKEEGFFIAPAASPQQREIVLDGLAHLLPERRVNFHTFLDSLPVMSGMDFLIVTPYVSPLIEQKADLLRARGNTVMFLPVEGS